MDINKIQNLKNQAISSILEAKSDRELEELRIAFLGRKGEITQLLKKIPSLNSSERKEMGQIANDVKRAVEQALADAKKAEAVKKIDIDKEWLDVTAPGKKPPLGHIHLVTETIKEITEIFTKIGFTRVAYPEVEWDWYSFGRLNMPANHPARDEWETLYIDKLKHKKYGRSVLTPHTSSGQVREMEKRKLPIRMLNIAKCYRRQSNVSHAPMFYQFETLVVDKGINVTHLKGTLDYFAQQYFGKDQKTRIRPFHFQFTEPSFEVDVTCTVCGGKGCQVCKGGWLELGGAGMVHPLVLKHGGIDPEKYSGFASGFGVERVLMMRHKIPDIRLLFGGDLRFLNQF